MPDPTTAAVEALARAIDPSGFEPMGNGFPPLHSWHAHKRHSACAKARKYIAALETAGFAIAALQPQGEKG